MPLAGPTPSSARDMLFAQEILGGFHRREGLRRNFDEDGIPTGHRAVPKARALERQEISPGEALFRDEHGTLIDET